MTKDWFQAAHPRPNATLRLFCFPYAGGSETIFRQWAGHLPDVEIQAVLLPGRTKRIRETPYRLLVPLITEIAQAILPLLDRDSAFFGHSMGAVLAYELAQTLRRDHEKEPCHLIVSGRHAPHLPDRRPPMYHLPKRDFINEVRRLNGTPKEVLENPEFLDMLLAILRADFELVQTYRYPSWPKLNCPLTALGGLQDRDVWVEDVESWNKHTNGIFEMILFQGDHFFIHSDQSSLFEVLVRKLSRPSF